MADSHRHSDRVIAVINSKSSAATSPIAASWCRSGLRHGIDPATDSRRELVSGARLSRLREANGLLLHVARPMLDHLFQTVGQTGCAVMLSDKSGIILESRATAADRGMFEQVGLTPGGQWAEDSEGTNGIGTCLAEGRPVTIHRDEHYASRNVDISCMDAPIHDAHGRLTAALDVSSCRDDHSLAMAHLIQKIVQEAARRIERGIFYEAYAGRRIIDANDPGSDAVLLAVDQDDIVVGATRAARQKFALTDTSLDGRFSAGDLLGQTPPASFEDAERATLRRALTAAGGCATSAARQLGISRATFYRRLDRAGMARGR